MDVNALKPNFLSNILVRLLSFLVLVFLARFAYVVTVKGNPNSCLITSRCYFSDPLHLTTPSAPAVCTAEIRRYYASVFQDLIAEGYLSPFSNSLCIETLTGQDVAALRDLGVSNSIGIISKKSSPPLVRYAVPHRQPFGDSTFDFEFTGTSGLDRAAKPVQFASEVFRTLKPGGFLVVHTLTNDAYSLNSLIGLFNNSFRLVNSRLIDGLDSLSIRQIILRKASEKNCRIDGDSIRKCSVPGYKHILISNAEPLIAEEPLKPWLALKRNMKDVKYLSSMVDISFKNRYVYVDVGARSYSSSIGSWFNKQYPKQNKTFEIYAIEADKAFHDEYRLKKKVTLLPYAAWVRNETLFFEISRRQSRKNGEKGRGMGRVQAVQSSSYFVEEWDRIQGFDFAAWLKGKVTEMDYVVMKMDVEGTEFVLIPRLIETGAIHLIDEMFLECHYNRWQRCCPGQRNLKYQKTYAQCLELLSSLRESGVLVHQWW